LCEFNFVWCMKTNKECSIFLVAMFRTPPPFRATLTRVTSPQNSNTGSSLLIFSVPFSYFLLIFHLPRCTLPDFPPVSSLASLPFLSCCHHSKTFRTLAFFACFSLRIFCGLCQHYLMKISRFSNFCIFNAMKNIHIYIYIFI